MKAIRVTDAHHLQDYTLEVCFSNGTRQVIALFGPRLTGCARLNIRSTAMLIVSSSLPLKVGI